MSRNRSNSCGRLFSNDNDRSASVPKTRNFQQNKTMASAGSPTKILDDAKLDDNDDK